MKKIFLSICLLVSSVILAQDNWITNITNGINDSTNFTVIHNFRDTLYVGGANINSNNILTMFRTANGTNFTEDKGLRNVPGNSGYDNRLTSAVSNNNYMFLGAGYGSGGGNAKPVVYRRDVAGNYTQHGTINTTILPSNDQGYITSISAEALYSPTGLNDSIYAFLTPGGGNVSVWKSPVGTANWDTATVFSSTSDFVGCTDAISWNGALYAAITGNNNNYIVKTTNGKTWTTVTTATTLGQPSNTSFSAFTVHQGKLMVSLSSSSGINTTPVYYTTNGTTWSSYFTYAAGAGTDIYGVADIKSFKGRLWIQAYTSSNSSPQVFYYTTQTGLKHSTGSVDVEQSQYTGSSFRLDTLATNNAIYTSGYTYGFTGGSSSVNYNYGITFSLKPPVASFTYATSPLCSGYNFFTNTSTNSSTFNWYLDGVSQSTSPSLYVSLTAGTHTLSLVSYGNGTGSISDSTAQVITVLPGFNQSDPSILVTPSSPVCPGQPFVVTDTTAYSGAPGPYTYYWQYPYGSGYAGSASQQMADTMTTGYSSHTYYHWVQSSNGCTSPSSAFGPPTTFTFTINVYPADSITGFVTDTNHLAVNGGSSLVYLFKQKSNHVGIGDTIGAVNISNGNFAFANVLYGDYYLKAIADTNIAIYKTSVGTYYNNNTNITNYQWYNGVVINHYHCNGGNDSLKNIQIIQTPAQTGTGIISGAITLTTSFGHRLSGSGNQTMGSPLKGIDVKLGKNPGGGCAARTTATTTATTSNATYTYTFTNVDADDYKIYVDIPNYGMDSARNVTISSSHSVSVNNDYYVDSTMIHVLETTGILKIVTTNSQLSLYPNPAADAANLVFENNAAANVTIQLFDIKGMQLATLYNQKTQQGKQTVSLNLGNLQLSPGVYFIRANINNNLETIKLTIIGN